MEDEPELDDLRDLIPSHCWVKRTLYKKGEDSVTNNQLLHFEDGGDETAIVKAFVGILIDYGKELGLTIFAPIHMDVGRWVIESEEGFSVIEIDPGWTEEQFDAMDEETATQLDASVWGSIFNTKLPDEITPETETDERE
jgi:hypothetical protein